MQSFEKLIPLTLLKEIKGLSNKTKAEPLVRELQGGLGTQEAGGPHRLRGWEVLAPEQKQVDI